MTTLTKQVRVLTFIAFFITSSFAVKATDIRVDEDGLNGAYTSIAAAIAAASDGDRIFIKPKSSNAWFIEDLNINKNLTFDTDIPGSQYKLQGTITISPKSGMVVIIKEMEGNSSTIINGSNFASTPSNRATVKVIESSFYSINMPTNYDLSVVKCAAETTIGLTAGKVIGCSAKLIDVNAETGSPLAATSDSLMIIANDLTANDDSQISLKSTSYLYIVANNKINYNNDSPEDSGILGKAWKASNSNGYHQIVNNQIVLTTGVLTYSVRIQQHPANSEIQILNNTLDGSASSSDSGIRVENGSLGVVLIGYNELVNLTSRISGSGNYTDSGTNYTSKLSSFTDKGSPDNIHLDLDLSRNDIGVNGGSHAWNNYWNTTTNRVYFLSIPKKIATGSTIKVKAESYSGN